MNLAYGIVAALTIALCLFSAGCDAVRYEKVGQSMDRVGVPRSWMRPLGVPKAAAALGLLAGFWLPALGTAAAAGLCVFFLAASWVHIRAHDHGFGAQHVFLVLAVLSLIFSVLR